MNYSEKLKSTKWQKKRLEILQRDEFTCKYCKDTETELQIHHLKYHGEPWEAKNENLITLCKDCHFIQESIKDISLGIILIEKLKSDFYTIILCKHLDKKNNSILLFFEKFENNKWKFVISFEKNGFLLNKINSMING